MIETRRNFSRRILFRLLVLGVIAAVIVFMNYSYVNDLYIKNQRTPLGMIINSGINEVIFEDEYEFSKQTQALFAEAGVACRQFTRGC